MSLKPEEEVGSKELVYNSHLEHLISSEAEKALVLSWLHDQSEKRYSRFNTRIMIPAIVLSTLAGSASIGQNALFGSGNEAPVIIGLVSLSVGVLNTVGSFFGWAKLAEGHRISGVNYSKLHRWISMELALPREQRVPAKHFLKEVRSQIDRLNETSPSIPPPIVALFTEKMKGIKHNVSLPEVCNEIHAVEVYSEEVLNSDSKRYVPPPAIRFRQITPIVSDNSDKSDESDESVEHVESVKNEVMQILDLNTVNEEHYEAP